MTHDKDTYNTYNRHYSVKCIIQNFAGKATYPVSNTMLVVETGFVSHTNYSTITDAINFKIKCLFDERQIYSTTVKLNAFVHTSTPTTTLPLHIHIHMIIPSL